MTSPVGESVHHRPDLSVDHQLALRIAASRLEEEFGDTIGNETIDVYLHTAYDHCASRARIPNFVPLFAERYARQRLRALARVEGKAHSGTPSVLFLCARNAGRSQMALGFFTHLAGDEAVAWSGGSDPADELLPAAVEAMAERGIDIGDEFPKPWTNEIVAASDVVITMGSDDIGSDVMGSEDLGPAGQGRRNITWEVADPAGQEIDAVRPIRDEIERRVRDLLAELEIPIATEANA